MTHTKQFHIRFEDVAVPEICSDDRQEEDETDEEETARDASDYDGPAVPEFHSATHSAVRR